MKIANLLSRPWGSQSQMELEMEVLTELKDTEDIGAQAEGYLRVIEDFLQDSTTHDAGREELDERRVAQLQRNAMKELIAANIELRQAYKSFLHTYGNGLDRARRIGSWCIAIWAAAFVAAVIVLVGALRGTFQGSLAITAALCVMFCAAVVSATIRARVFRASKHAFNNIALAKAKGIEVVDRYKAALS